MIKRLITYVLFGFLISFNLSGQVGLGTITPSQALDIEVDTTGEMGIDINNTGGGDPIIHLQIDSVNTFTLGVDNTDSDKFKIGSVRVDTMAAIIINSSGDVGFGDTIPIYKLEVDGDANTTNSTGVYRIGADHALSKPNTKNLYIGEGAGAQNNAAGTDNLYIGFQAGYSSTGGDYNVSVGNEAGYNSTSAAQSVTIGYQAGYSASTSVGSIRLGYQAGYGATGSNMMHLDNSSTGNPLLYVSSFANDEVNINGGLIVNEQSAAQDFRVESSNFTNMLYVNSTSDYVHVRSSSNVINNLIQVNSTTATAGFALVKHSDDSTGANWSNVKSRGSEATPSAVIDNDLLAPLRFVAHDGDDYNSVCATIEAKVDGPPGSGDMPTELRFQTTADGTVSQSIRMVLSDQGDLGIGTTSPSAKLDVEESGTTVLTINRLTDDGTLMDFQVDGVSEGSINVSGATLSYNAFTGSHFGLSDSTFDFGKVVILTGKNAKYNNAKNGETLYGIKYSSEPNDKKVLGAYLGVLNPADSVSMCNPHQIMAVGNGKMWVTNEGGDIKSGDFLITSSTKGMAMKDNGFYPVSYICARAVEKVNWRRVKPDADGVKKVLLNVSYESFAIENNVKERIERLRESVKELQELAKQKKAL